MEDESAQEENDEPGPIASFDDGFMITRWLQKPAFKPTFTKAESSFIFGGVHTGKSRLAVRLALMFRKRANAQIIDAFGAENDSESTVWLLAPETRDKTLAICGNEFKVEGWDNTMHVAEFTLEAAKDYDVIVTDRSLFGPIYERKWDFKYYAALARIFQLCRWREGGNRLVNLVIREAWNLIYSQIEAGISRDEQAAMRAFRKMHNQRFHSRVAPTMDTQNYMELAKSVRSLSDFKYIKGFGDQEIPRSLSWIFKPWLFGRNDYLVRNTPIDEFIMVTRRNGLARGVYADIPWHIEKGFSPLRRLGIKVTALPKVGGEIAKDPWEGAGYVPSNNDLHRRMQELHDEGFSYKDIAGQFGKEGIEMSWEKVRYHLSKQCSCEVTVGPAPREAQGPLYPESIPNE